jgi:hypothetical protein
VDTDGACIDEFAGDGEVEAVRDVVAGEEDCGCTVGNLGGVACKGVG